MKKKWVKPTLQRMIAGAAETNATGRRGDNGNNTRFTS